MREGKGAPRQHSSSLPRPHPHAATGACAAHKALQQLLKRIRNLRQRTRVEISAVNTTCCCAERLLQRVDVRTRAQ